MSPGTRQRRHRRRSRADVPAPPPRPEAELDPLDETGTFPIRGRVLDPDGRPVAGAVLYVLHRAYNEISKEMVDFRDRPGRVDGERHGRTVPLRSRQGRQ